MQAFYITEPRRTERRELDRPAPGPDEVLLRVRVVGLCGSDLNTWRGRNPLVSYPRIPGHEIAATIEATGPLVPPPWQVGMRVTLSPYTSCGACPACRQGRHNSCQFNQTLGVQRDGALADFIAVPAGKLFTSAALPLEQLALVEPLTVGAHAVARGRVTAADTVCVLGCGAIGLGAVAAAAFRKARVVAVDIDDAKLATARRAGAAEAVNSAREDLHARLGHLTGGEGPAVVIEAIGLPATFRAAVGEAAFAGRVVYVGYAKEPVAYETRLFVQKELDILGSRNATPEDFRQVIRMLEAGAFPAGEAITRVAPFEEAGETLQAWDADPAAFTKILIRL